jgi:hypothetical protein
VGVYYVSMFKNSPALHSHRFPLGPPEGFVSPSGLAIEHSSNGCPCIGSIRMERRATLHRDAATLRLLAEIHTATGASHAANHCRALAEIVEETGS